MTGPRKEFIYPILSILGLAVLILTTVKYLSGADDLPFKKLRSALETLNRAARTQKNGDFKIRKFTSEEEFSAYLSNAYSLGQGFTGSSGMRMPIPQMDMLKQGIPSSGEIFIPERYSQTNVQVEGVDEADILKTDGREIYYSSQNNFFEPVEPTLTEEQSAPGMYPEPPNFRSGGISSIKAFPPSDLKVDSKIKKTGEMLLSGSKLMVFSGDKIYGYDVSDPKNPKEIWEMSLKEGNEIAGTRLYKSKLYIIEKSFIRNDWPCPVEILFGPKEGLRIPCQEIYHPTFEAPVDVIYTALVINPDDGKIFKTISFVGSSSQSVVYMSKENLYVTFYSPGDFISFYYNFFSENDDLLGSELTFRLAKLRDYEISNTAKMMELVDLIQKYTNQLDNDDRLKTENELNNRMNTFSKKHKRELERTGIVKIELEDFSVAGNGFVPGTLLDQFSLDEHEENLRAATTVGGNFSGLGFLNGRSESANDLYVLDKSLNLIGQVTNLGVTERIYSARFLGDKAYLVTFRQTDPFYVLDLSNPKSPRLSGELKIPGFSSYLHPLSENLILGVGQEDGRVKLSLFDVRDSENPVETDKYSLDEYWTEVQNNHRAFQYDKKFGVFFLPGGSGGYVFSHEGNKLKLVKAVSGISARRAAYINNYFYVAGDDKVVVLNEDGWERVNELDLP